MIGCQKDGIGNDAKNDDHVECFFADDALQSLLESDKASWTLPVAESLVEPFVGDL